MNALVGLVRHGSHDDLGTWLSGRTRDVALNTAGREQAAVLARRLAGQGVTAILTSPRRRTLETAEILGKGLGLKAVPEDALDEIDFGDWSGARFSDLDPDPDWQHWNTARSAARAPSGETMAGAVDRAMACLDRLALTGSGPVLCVSHCDIIRGVIAHVSGLGLDRILQFDIDPASVSWVTAHGQGKARVLTINGTG